MIMRDCLCCFHVGQTRKPVVVQSILKTNGSNTPRPSCPNDAQFRFAEKDKFRYGYDLVAWGEERKGEERES